MPSPSVPTKARSASPWSLTSTPPLDLLWVPETINVIWVSSVIWASPYMVTIGPGLGREDLYRIRSIPWSIPPSPLIVDMVAQTVVDMAG
jgi:hypothetical protein